VGQMRRFNKLTDSLRIVQSVIHFVSDQIKSDIHF